MERITSRKNAVISRLRTLAKDAAFRRSEGEILCDGAKLLEEALHAGAEVRSVLWKEAPSPLQSRLTPGAKEFCCPAELFDYASPMANSPGPLFTVCRREAELRTDAESILVLENVQDPGNVGTVIRTANAFGIDAVLLVGDCADCTSPKTVRATMGAIFRQSVLRMERKEMKAALDARGLRLYGAVLSERAQSICTLDLGRCAVAVGSEGKGLSGELRALCDGEIIIPMNPESESLNAAVAASVLMWEMRGKRL